MKEYIERAAVLNLLEKINPVDFGSIFDYKAHGAVGECLREICYGVENIPATDVVPVVRCRDCKWFNHYTMECESDDVATDHEGGASFSINFGPDDFCSYGQRKIETVLPKSDAKDESLEAEHEI